MSQPTNIPPAWASLATKAAAFDHMLEALALAEKYLAIHGQRYEPTDSTDDLGADTRYAAAVAATAIAKAKGGAA
jgi:hypothetical protein